MTKEWKYLNYKEYKIFGITFYKKHEGEDLGEVQSYSDGEYTITKLCPICHNTLRVLKLDSLHRYCKNCGIYTNLD